MEDAECAETNEKSIIHFLWFLVFEIWSFLYSKVVNFSMNFEYKIDHNSKNKNGKIDFIYSFQLFALLFCKFGHFRKFFFLSVTHENPGVSPVTCKYNQP